MLGKRWSNGWYPVVYQLIWIWMGRIGRFSFLGVLQINIRRRCVLSLKWSRLFFLHCSWLRNWRNKEQCFGKNDIKKSLRLVSILPLTSCSQEKEKMPPAISLIIGNDHTTLLSISEPKILQKASQIHGVRSQIATKITICVFSFPLMHQCRAVG